MIIKDESAFKTYYVCFERPVGSNVWTLAFRKKGTVFISMSRKDATSFCTEVHRRKPDNCARIATVLLPAGIDTIPYAEP